MWQYNYTDALYHYGVPGMRWGHRKGPQKSTKEHSIEQKVSDGRDATTKVMNTVLATESVVEIAQISKRHINKTIKIIKGVDLVLL